jgi:hypothetical protein
LHFNAGKTKEEQEQKNEVSVILCFKSCPLIDACLGAIGSFASPLDQT